MVEIVKANTGFDTYTSIAELIQPNVSLIEQH